MPKQEITKDAMLMPGDEIELHYRIIGPALMQAVQIAIVESKINKDERFYLRGYTPAESNDTANYIFRVTVKQPPRPETIDPNKTPEPMEAAIPIAALLIVIGSAFAGLFLFMSLQKIYKIIQTPAGAVLGVSGAVGLAVAAWWFFLRK